MEHRRYGLFTTIAMITGIVIGSGIFFKSDNILVYTGGNVILGVAVFAIAAVSIIFGSLAIAQLAAKTDTAGGVISYAELFCSRPAACAFGWFQTFLYYPTMSAVVSWVAGFYLCILTGIPDTLENQVLVGAAVLAFLYLVNTFSAKLGGIFQSASTIIKLIPLVIIAFAGLFSGNTPELLAAGSRTLEDSPGWLGAIAPIAFSFDGWIVSTTICHEIKNSRRNLPLALIIAPTLILVVYVLYFTGVCSMVGPDQVMALEDAHVEFAASSLFGPIGARLILVFVVVSVLGTVNGLTLGSIRVPQALASRGMLPGSKALARENPKLGGLSFPSAGLSFAVTLLWTLINYLTQKYGVLPNSDVSEVPVVLSYATYIVLYAAVIRLARSGEIPGVLKGYLYPTLAIVGAAIIIIGGLFSPHFFLYAFLCLLITASAVAYYHRNERRG